MMAADGLVLGSPVYISHVTGLLKNWIDHLANTIHCQRLLGKYGAVVSTTGGSGLKETADYLEWLLRHTGAQTVGRWSAGWETGLSLRMQNRYVRQNLWGSRSLTPSKKALNFLSS